MAAPPIIFKQSKDPLQNTGTSTIATIGDIWIDLNDVPATIKTLVTATGGVAYWAVKKSEILGSEISLSGQTAKSIDSDESILFKINGANKFKISSATIPSGTIRIGELSTTTIVPPSWDQLSIANPESEINVTPVPYDAYSRVNVTNFSDESGGGFVFKVGDEKLLSLRPLATPRLNLSNMLAAPVEGQIVIGDSTPAYDDMDTATIGSAKLVVNGNMVIGNSSKANFIAFRGTEGDDIIGHTYIGERLRSDYPAGSEGSELILFKGNDAQPGVNVDRIRHIAANHVFQTWGPDSSVAGTFNQIATTSTAKTRFSISPGGRDGVTPVVIVGDPQIPFPSGPGSQPEFAVYGNAQITQSLSVAGNTFLTGLATVTALANLYVDGAGKLYKADSVGFAFESLLSQSGYQKLPSGMIIQWGLLTIPQNGVVNTTFPIAFNTVFGVVLTSNSGTNTGAASSNYKAVANVTTTGFQGQSAEGNRANFWIAFGS